MNTKKCEEYLISAMAMADGEDCPLDPAEVSAHLAGCPDCRRELAGLERLGETLEGLGIAPRPVGAWPGIRAALPGGTSSPVRRLALFGLAALLPAWKLVDIVADLPAAQGFRLIPVALALLLFACVRENPFTIKPAIQPDGDPA